MGLDSILEPASNDHLKNYNTDRDNQFSSSHFNKTLLILKVDPEGNWVKAANQRHLTPPTIHALHSITWERQVRDIIMENAPHEERRPLPTFQFLLGDPTVSPGQMTCPGSPPS